MEGFNLHNIGIKAIELSNDRNKDAEFSMYLHIEGGQVASSSKWLCLFNGRINNK